MNDFPNSSAKFLVPIAILLVAAFAIFSAMTVIVQSGNVGVITTLGAVQPNALPEGFHFKKPFIDSVQQIDIRLTASHAQATAASKDLQSVTTQVTMQYSLNGALAPQIYQRIGLLSKVSASLVEPAIQECVKGVTAKFTAEELVTKRELVKQQIQDALSHFINNTLREKGLENAVNIANLAITDFNFSPEFNRAIEAKVKAEQMALQAKNEKIMRVTQAEASAEERKLAASAEAFSTEVQSKARADAIQREALALKQSPEIIQLRSIEKWDGVLPRISGVGVVPFLNVGDMQGNSSSGSTPGATPQR
ncbi:MAG: prohibitin family protein [Verrucomicrobia bacterium]|nr:prohibitin family protein [Verrucomicrobiota bacterium]